jgi:hypothetical protein
MSIKAHRVEMLALAGSLIFAGGSASAQVDQSAAANILIECAKIDDATARLACYDNNVRNLDPTAFRAAPRGASGGAPAAQGPQGFGLDSVRVREQRFEPVPSAERQVQTTVSAAREREPGIYLVTLDDGAQWVFTEGVTFGFRPPRRGQTIQIERGALGSFLMRIDDQEPVPVRRLR